MTGRNSSRLLFVNYHYSRDPNAYRFPGIHSLAIDAFRAQVEWLRARFRFATRVEVDRFLIEGIPLPEPSVFLTFDDGLVDHWQAKCEVLDPLGIQAGFFVCSRPAVEGRVLSVHKVHWLRAHTEPNAFASEFLSHVPENLRPAADAPWLDAARRTYIYDTESAAHLKYALNFVLPSDLVDNITSAMMAERGIDEREFCRLTYMGDAELRSLVADGHALGVHGHTHEPFSRLGSELPYEIGVNHDYLTRASGAAPRWVSYPYGRKDAIPEPYELDRLFTEFGFDLGFTLLGNWNDGTQDRRRLHRINTNDLQAAVQEFV
jgi:peptidoglycan/xylan/chitin deacetylase (PgdA/CDA1 family)